MDRLRVSSGVPHGGRFRSRELGDPKVSLDSEPSRIEIIEHLERIRVKSEQLIQTARKVKINEKEVRSVLSGIVESKRSLTSELSKTISRAVNSEVFDNERELDKYYVALDDLYEIERDIQAATIRAESGHPQLAVEAQKIIEVGYGDGIAFSCPRCSGPQTEYNDEFYYCQWDH